MPTQLFTSENAGDFADKRWKNKNDASKRAQDNKIWEQAAQARTEQSENNSNSLLFFQEKYACTICTAFSVCALFFQGKYAMSTRNTPRVDISQTDARNVTCDDRLLDEFIQQLMKLAQVCFFLVYFVVKMAELL